MHKPHGFALMIGITPKHDGDEDSLDREGQGNEGDDDLATEAIVSVIHALHDQGPAAVRNVRAFADALLAMADAHMDKDRAGFEQACHEARDALDNLIND